MLLLHLVDELALEFLSWCFLMNLFLHIDLPQPKSIGLRWLRMNLNYRLISLIIARTHTKILKFGHSILGRNAILNVQLILLTAKIYVLSSVEIKRFLFLVFHGEIISSYLNLVKLIWVD